MGRQASGTTETRTGVSGTGREPGKRKESQHGGGMSSASAWLQKDHENKKAKKMLLVDATVGFQGVFFCLCFETVVQRIF